MLKIIVATMRTKHYSPASVGAVHPGTECRIKDGEIQIKEDADGKLIWKCPNCGNTDETKLNVARRTCGYIGTQFWNQGRTQEIKERVLHL